MNPPLTPPRRGTDTAWTHACSPPGRGRGWVFRFMERILGTLSAHCAPEPLAVRSSRSQSALIYLKMGGLTSAAERFMGRVLPLNPLSLNRVVRWVGAAIFLAQSLVFASDALSPQDALKHMKVGAGFEVELVASEPEIRQPLSICFDARGRTSAIQYLQYRAPAGLKPVSVDQ